MCRCNAVESLCQWSYKLVAVPAYSAQTETLGCNYTLVYKRKEDDLGLASSFRGICCMPVLGTCRTCSRVDAALASHCSRAVRSNSVQTEGNANLLCGFTASMAWKQHFAEHNRRSAPSAARTWRSCSLPLSRAPLLTSWTIWW